MLIRQSEPFEPGYTPITALDGKHSDMLLDFGILVLEAGDSFSGYEDSKEQACLLLDGDAEFCVAGQVFRAGRSSVLDEGPWTLHTAAGTPFEIRALRRCEFAVEKTLNPDPFPPRVYTPGESRSQQFGAGTMQETSTRTVRTVFDAATHAVSRMVLGEVINHPGKWSSYPPHLHPHPEIYHYRFFPGGGFGFAQTGDEVVRVTNGDTLTIAGGVDHPQTAAPGYAMFYVWMIPHLPDNRFGPDSRVFNPDHSWVMQPDAPIWEAEKQVKGK